VSRHPGILFRALTWNLFHGRDHPPPGDPDVNRPLLDEFLAVLDREQWDVALLQEAPPRWFDPLRARLGVDGALVLTSRNFGSALRGRIADWKPDLIKSSEGGSNQILVRRPWAITATRHLTLARLPERRRLLWARLEHEACEPLAVANMHMSANRPHAAARELLRAAGWCPDEHLLFGGDLNLRPAEDAATYAALEQRFGLGRPTAPHAIDHLLARGLELVEAPRQLSPGRREVEAGRGLRIRLSDHAPVAAVFAMR
jgi:endonuclease/exonuclease/phosphatase family metal-dependent hydrolase